MTQTRKKSTRKKTAATSRAAATSTPANFAAGAPAANVRYQLQLYVTGTSPRSTQAIANLRALCEEHLTGRYDLEVIDLYQEPARAAAGQVIASPTLVKTLPKPLMRMVGNLANREHLMIKLNLDPESAPAVVRHLP